MRRATLLTLAVTLVLASPLAAATTKSMVTVNWSFAGIFGTYDRASAQRGFQVYKEVCGNCHAAKYFSFRNLQALGLTEDEVKAVAAEFEVEDGPDADGAMFKRPARPSDRMPSRFANEQAARAANNGAFPVDLSLITKARKNGPDYLYSLMTGYGQPPASMAMGDGMSFNPFFSSSQIAMPPPLADGQVIYADGTAATRDQMAQDVVTFLAWLSEPEMEERKQMGIKVILFLIAMTAIFFAAKRRVWADVHD